MKTRSKALLLSLCAVLLVAASVLGTMAYLTDSETVTNTFTVGQVHLTLDEAKVNPMGQPLDKNGKAPDEEGYESGKLDRWQPTTDDPEQEYHLLPGHSYTKDPTVTVDAGSEESYVRMMATITYKAEADAVFAEYKTDNLFAPWLNINNDWQVNGDPMTTKDEGAGTISRTYEFRYKTTVDASEAQNGVKLAPLFTTLTVPGGVTNEEIAYLADMNITVEAHAIQASGFESVDAAWNAFDTQKNA